MANKIRFVPNPRGIAEYESSDEAHSLVRPHAEQVLSAAQASAPVLTGEYRDGLHIEDDPSGLRVGGSTDHDIYVEADTGNLNRALDAAGGS